MNKIEIIKYTTTGATIIIIYYINYLRCKKLI